MREAASRKRSYAHFFLGVIVYFVARTLSGHSALARGSEPVREVVALALFALLLWVGYSWLGRMLWKDSTPMAQQGWPLREGWTAEVGLGIAIGWGLALLCVIPMALGGGLAIVLNLHLPAWGWLLIDVLYFALLAAVEELGFRGYGFQRLADAVGPVGASIAFAALYVVVQSWIAGATRMSLLGAILFSLVLSTAYVRTQALWVSWGINFGWKASRALLFGLAVDGMNHHSNVVQGNPMTSYGLSGGGFGLEGSWVAILLMLILWPVLFRLLQGVVERNQPEQPVAAWGIPVDLGTGCQDAASQLVSIPPAASPQLSAPEEPAGTEGPREEGH